MSFGLPPRFRASLSARLRTATIRAKIVGLTPVRRRNLAGGKCLIASYFVADFIPAVLLLGIAVAPICFIIPHDFTRVGLWTQGEGFSRGLITSLTGDFSKRRPIVPTSPPVAWACMRRSAPRLQLPSRCGISSEE